MLELIFLAKVLKCVRAKFAKKVWVLAPTSLKSMGAEATTAPILSETLL